MNVFYCGCIKEPWLDVAKILHNKGYNASYFIGWEDAEEEIKSQLPVVFHEMNKAWRGVFPDEVLELSPFPVEIDGMKLSNFSYDELMAIRMMERMDRDGKSFTFKERQHFFRRQLNDWIFILKYYKIDLIVFPVVPHRVFDYVIYVAAKMLGINFLNFKITRWPGRLIPLHSTITKIPNFTDSDNNITYGDVEQYVHEIRSKKYNEIEPDYMVEQKKDADTTFVRKLIDKAVDQPQKISELFNDFPNYWKKKNQRIEDSAYNRLEIYVDEYKGVLYKKSLKKYYDSLTYKPNLNEKFIFVPLHYQPEATSIPDGNIYGDQLMLVRALLKHTSEDTLIYVKEHTSQFIPKLEGQTARTKEFYDQLLIYPRVKLIPTHLDPFSLIDKAYGTATLVGNSALEAVIRNKPVLLFGNTWFEHCHGVLKINNLADLNEISSHFDDFNPNPNLLVQQFNNVISKSIRANHYKNVADRSNISNEESIENLSKYIINNFPL